MLLDTRAFSGALSVAAMLAYVSGAVVDALIPWGAPAFVSLIFRVDVVELAQPFAWDSLIIGLITFAAVGAALGAFVAWAYNAFAGRSTIHASTLAAR